MTTTIVIPSTVTSINNNAFCNLSYIYNISIPSSVVSVGNTVFNGTGFYETTVPSINVSVSGAIATISMSDNKGVIGWKVTSTTAIPSTWDSVSYAASATKNWTASANGTYYAHVKDINGNTAYKQFTVTELDSTPPAISLSASPSTTTNGNVTISATITDSSSFTSKWAAGNQSASYFTSAGTSFTGSFSVSANGTYTVYAVDAYNNSAVKTIAVNNIDKTPPTAPGISYDCE